jgi:sec-independent protein translocase protein TatC
VGSLWFNSALGQLRIMEKPGHIMAVSLGSGSMIAQQYRVGEYIDLVLMMGLAFGLAFQVPLVLMLLSWTGIVRPEHLTPYRKKIIFGCVVGAALLPTQDPWSLLVLSLMLIGLFEFGILLMRFMPLRRLIGLGPRPTHAPALTDGDAEA